ncbi:hypothetical protein [Anaerosporobacter sp.]
MEYAIQINNIKYLKNVTQEYSRIYYGNEFCPHLGISLGEVKQVVEFCSINHKELTLVTPYIIEDYREAIEAILKYLVEKNVKCEIVINDWGLLYHVNRVYNEQFELVLGCLLNKMKKSPVVMNLIDKVSVDTRQVLETASLNLEPTWDIIEDLKIKRVEFENTLQGNRIENKMPFEKSLRYPYIFITTARKCITNYCVKNLPYYNLVKCSQSCKETYLSLYNRIMQRELVLKGNTLFYKNDILPDNLEKEFSRLVFNASNVMDV